MGDEFRFRLGLVNSGKTPALNISIAVVPFFGNRIPPEPHWDQLKRGPSATAFFPSDNNRFAETESRLPANGYRRQATGYRLPADRLPATGYQLGQGYRPPTTG
jgi:hypothetical protein